MDAKYVRPPVVEEPTDLIEYRFTVRIQSSKELDFNPVIRQHIAKHMGNSLTHVLRNRGLHYEDVIVKELEFPGDAFYPKKPKGYRKPRFVPWSPPPPNWTAKQLADMAMQEYRKKYNLKK